MGHLLVMPLAVCWGCCLAGLAVRLRPSGHVPQIHTVRIRNSVGLALSLTLPWPA